MKHLLKFTALFMAVAMMVVNFGGVLLHGKLRLPFLFFMLGILLFLRRAIIYNRKVIQYVERF